MERLANGIDDVEVVVQYEAAAPDVGKCIVHFQAAEDEVQAA